MASVQNQFKLGKTKLNGIWKSRYLKELDRIDGKQIEFEWTNFPGFTTLGILNEIQKMMAESRCEPEQFQGRIIFMSMFNDIMWSTPGNEENCVANTLNVATHAKRFPLGCWSYLGPGCEKMWYGTHVNKPNGEWNRVAEIMMINFAESGHPKFQATSPLERGELKSKGGGKKTIHHNGSEETVELILRTIISVNQLSIYGAAADMRNELDPDYAEIVICESLVIPTESADANATSQSSTSSAQGNLF